MSMGDGMGYVYGCSAKEGTPLVPQRSKKDGNDWRVTFKRIPEWCPLNGVEKRRRPVHPAHQEHIIFTNYFGPEHMDVELVYK